MENDKLTSKESSIQPLIFPVFNQNTLLEKKDETALCLLCEKCFSLYPDTNKYLEHLLVNHKFIIADVKLIAHFKSYVTHWRNRFFTSSYSEFCSVIKTNSAKTDTAPSEYYYLLSDALPEDKQLREKLQQERLKEVLHQQHFERMDTTFSKGCLFCKKHFTGNRAELFKHLSFDHNFHIGAPDNIVFGNELIDVLQEKLNELICIYCEKIFKDWMSLKEHMRKKQHKRINPTNKAYDKFYIINYLELGKNWEEVQDEDDVQVQDDDNEWSDWHEDMPGAVCLFCEFTSSDLDELVLHMQDVHKFNFQALKQKVNLEFYQQIKFINYIRRQVHLKSCLFCSEIFSTKDELLEHMTNTEHISSIPETKKWDQPQYYFPTYENDNLLWILDDGSEEESQNK